LKQRAASCSEVMLNRIGKCEKIAARVFDSVAEPDQLLPAIDCDEPAVLQIAVEFFRLDAEVDNVRVCPDKRMKWFEIGDGRTICFPPMHTHGAGFAQLNGHNSRRRVRAEKQRVLLKFHLHKLLSFRAKSWNPVALRPGNSGGFDSLISLSLSLRPSPRCHGFPAAPFSTGSG